MLPLDGKCVVSENEETGGKEGGREGGKERRREKDAQTQTQTQMHMCVFDGKVAGVAGLGGRSASRARQPSSASATWSALQRRRPSGRARLTSSPRSRRKISPCKRPTRCCPVLGAARGAAVAACPAGASCRGRVPCSSPLWLAVDHAEVLGLCHVPGIQASLQRDTDA